MNLGLVGVHGQKEILGAWPPIQPYAVVVAAQTNSAQQGRKLAQPVMESVAALGGKSSSSATQVTKLEAPMAQPRPSSSFPVYCPHVLYLLCQMVAAGCSQPDPSMLDLHRSKPAPPKTTCLCCTGRAAIWEGKGGVAARMAGTMGGSGKDWGRGGRDCNRAHLEHGISGMKPSSSMRVSCDFQWVGNRAHSFRGDETNSLSPPQIMQKFHF